jgi:hypothetical protein
MPLSLTKECTICRVAKPGEEFHVVRQGNRRYSQGRCKVCSKEYLRAWISTPENRLKRTAAQRRRNFVQRYGITEAIYEAMREAQGNACAICKRTFTDTPSVDHDHATGAVRGLLCQGCNHGIGLLREDVNALYAAIEYLSRVRGLHAVA